MEPLRRVWPLLLVVALSLFVTGFRPGDGPPGSGSRTGDDRTVGVIITFNQLPNSVQLGLVADLGARVGNQYQTIPAVSARVPATMLAQMEYIPGVLKVEPDGPVWAVDGPATLAQTVPWGIDRINAPDVHSFDTGTGVKVAVIDTGLDLDHPDLNVAPGVSFVPGVPTPDDDNGHGTHVGGTIAALDNTVGVLGGAPDVLLYPVKVLDLNGSGTWSGVIAGIDWAVANGMQVVNMSLGASSAPSAVQTAIQAAYDAGVVLVAAAGVLEAAEKGESRSRCVGIGGSLRACP